MSCHTPTGIQEGRREQRPSLGGSSFLINYLKNMNPQTEEAEIVLSRKNKIWTHGSTPLKSFKKQRQKENLESNESGKTNDLARQWPSDRWQVSKEQRRSQKTREGHLQYIENTYLVTEHSIPCRRLIPEVKQSNFHSSRVCHWRSLTHSLRGLFRNVLPKQRNWT